MGNNKVTENVLSEDIIKLRQEYAEELKHKPSFGVNSFLNELQDQNLQKAFKSMFHSDGSFTEAGKADFERFKKFKLNVTGSTTYYVVGKDQRDLYKFLIYYIIAERKYKMIKMKRKLEKSGKPVDDYKIAQQVFRLTPVIVFVSTFVDYEINNLALDESWGDGFGRILAIYVPRTQPMGKTMELYATKVREYASIKNHVNEHAIILAEANFNEFTAGCSLPVIDLINGEMKYNTNVRNDEEKVVSNVVGTRYDTRQAGVYTENGEII